MVANYKDTVRFDKKTVAFRQATDWLKDVKSVKYKEMEAAIGMKEKQMDMLRAFRRRVLNTEIAALVEKYPETVQFFKDENDTTSEHGQIPPVTHQMKEPMGTHFYGKKPEPWPELVETQKKLIERLEADLSEVKERLRVVEAERKTLVEIVSQRK